MSDWYDRAGRPLTIGEANALLGDLEYKRVASTTITSAVDPDYSVWVSTVWLGLDHNFINFGLTPPPPHIFETMAWEQGDLSEMYCERYSTEAAAKEGHAKIVAEMIERVTGPAQVVAGSPPIVTDGLTEPHSQARAVAMEECRRRMQGHAAELGVVLLS
jgi:hypothetical protein